MKFRKWISLLLLFAFGCTTVIPSVVTNPTQTPRVTATLPEPSVRVTHVPNPEDRFRDFFDAWKQDNYAAMYGFLTGSSKGAISEEDFTKRYLDVVSAAAVGPGALEYEILSSIVHSKQAQISYQVNLSSALYGDLTRQNQVDLELFNGEWQLVWDDSLILPELAGGNQVRIQNDIPARGEIYDKDGEVIVGYSDAYAVGLVPARIDPDLEEAMLTQLSRVTGYSQEYLFSLYVDDPDTENYIPITDVSVEAPVGAVSGFDAVLVSSFSGRYYYNAGIAPQTIGYTSAIQPEEVTGFMRQGYMWTERVAREGVELWADEYLSGERGGNLLLYTENDDLITILGQRQSAPAATIFTTIDRELQIAAQNAIVGFNGAVIALERDTGRVLAMASSPGYNPNLFHPDNVNARFTSPQNNPDAPLFNRATQGQYPLGSVFKIITLSTALESGRFTEESTYECGHEFTELENPILYDWTYWDEEDPSGKLTLPEGLMRSCNPWFWHIGLDLFNAGLTSAIADMARGFGLGSPTGIVEIPEKSGQVPEPGEKLEATNLAIGQGDLLVTPLQVARFVAAVGNGGTLYRPQIIERIELADGQVVNEFEPDPMGELTISPETLAIIQGAMRQVVRNSRGTAYRTLGAFPIEVAGKTSTSETGVFDPDAWFVSYSDEGREDKPEIVVIAIVEKVGEGADFAAPIVRRVLEYYFFERPRSLYPWEVRIGVPRDLIPEEDEGE